NERLDRLWLHRRAVLADAVVRRDQVLDLRAQLGWKTGDAADRLAHQHQSEGDVADEISVARVAGGSAFVRELLKLADVVQHDAGEDEILVGVIRASDE